MEAIMLAAIAVQVIRRSYQVASSLYQSVPKLHGSIIIEVTTSDGKTSLQETITQTNATKSTPSSTTTITSILDTFAYHIQTIWLFTYSDAKTNLIPWTLFGLAQALSAPYFGINHGPSTFSILARTPLTMTWVFLNLLAFDISNQRHAISIIEDSINKPWRPFPAKRISTSAGQYLLVAAYKVAFLFSLRYGGVAPCLSLLIFGYIHNDMGAGDRNWIARNALNGLGFVSFGAGATEVAFSRALHYSPILVQWLRIIALVIFTSVQSQDLYDQEGDAQVGRSTLPLVIGDRACRWSIAVPVLAWSLICPWFWGMGLSGYICPVVGAVVVAWRTLSKRTVKDDRRSFLLWCLWLVSIYCLPLVKFVVAQILG